MDCNFPRPIRAFQHIKGLPELEVKFNVGWDHRNLSCGHGLHGMEICFVLAGPHLQLYYVLGTGWTPTQQDEGIRSSWVHLDTPFECTDLTDEGWTQTFFEFGLQALVERMAATYLKHDKEVAMRLTVAFHPAYV